MASIINNSELAPRNGTNSSSLSVYYLDTYLFTFLLICSSIGLVFNILCIIRYCRRPSLRSPFTYIFHFILIYCLLASLFINPSLLIGYYGYAFTYYRIYCKWYAVSGSLMYVGIAYSLLYAGIERHFIIFRRNGQVSYIRQIIPMSIIFILALLASSAFQFIPTCPYIPCVPCSAFNLKLLIFWQAFSFYIPLICLIITTVVLIIRVQIYRRQFHHHRQANQYRPSKRISLHLCIYVVWSLIYYCPPALYNLVSAIDSERYSSPAMKSISTSIGVLGIQLYPILTYAIFWSYKLKRKKRSRVKPQGTVMIMAIKPYNRE